MIAIIQARMSSKRFKGKVLKKINDNTILDIITKRIQMSQKVKKIIIATSKKKSDDKISNFCKKNKILCFRGSLNNVYQRYCDVVKKIRSKAFVRICADSPFIDPFLIDKLLKIFEKGKYDIVTNILERTYPKGQSIEIFKTKVFLGQQKKIKKMNDKEHVTTFFYRNRRKFKIKNVEMRRNYSKINFCVDYKKDLKFVSAVSKKLNILKKNKNSDLMNLIKVAKTIKH